MIFDCNIFTLSPTDEIQPNQPVKTVGDYNTVSSLLNSGERNFVSQRKKRFISMTL